MQPEEIAITDAMQGFEAALSVPAGFMLRLRDEDDWSFVVKSHALLEAALTHLLVYELGRPEARAFLARLDTSDSQTGKVALAKQLGVLHDDEMRLIGALSGLRNRVVHNLGDTAFTFEIHVSTLDSNQLSAFADSFSFYLRLVYGSSERRSPQEVRTKSIPEARHNPKLLIWRSVVAMLWQFSFRATYGSLQDSRRRIGERLLVYLVGQSMGA
jgi:hypothetical protein